MKNAIIAALALSTLAIPEVEAMSLYEAKQEACAAAQEYMMYGSYSQARNELIAYSQYLGRETGNANNKYAILNHAEMCLY